MSLTILTSLKIDDDGTGREAGLPYILMMMTMMMMMMMMIVMIVMIVMIMMIPFYAAVVLLKRIPLLLPLPLTMISANPASSVQ